MFSTTQSIIKFFIIVIMLMVVISQRRSTNYWKERYTDTSVWADTLYEENLRLSDSLIYYRKLQINLSLIK